MGELGFFGITVDTEHGGLGLGAYEYCMVAEELARAWMSVGSIIARAQGAGTGVADPARRGELLRRSASGSGSARSRCPSRTRVPTSRPSPPGPSVTATSTS
ncbi:acyl-CoA dehydrogenase family protein [Pseudonocardia benzenivorans]